MHILKKEIPYINSANIGRKAGNGACHFQYVSPPGLIDKHDVWFAPFYTQFKMQKKLPTSDDLICCATIFNSHEDFSVYEALYAGYDEEWNLIILCEHTDDDHPRFNRATYAIVTKDEAFRLAKRLKVSLTNLPMEIAESMSEWEEIVCPVPSDVRACFKEVTECLVDEGCHFRIERTS